MKTRIFQILGVAAIASLGLASCDTDSDACKDVTCENGGTCIDGTCECPEGFGGTDCSMDYCAAVVCDATGGTLTPSSTGCDCVCEEGYEGEDCATEERAKFVGSYLASGTAVCPVSGNGTITNEAMSIANSSTSVTKVTISMFGLLFTGTVDGSDLTLDQTTISGYVYTGSGTITTSGMTLNLVINEEEPNVETCVYTLTCTKQ